MLSPFKELRNKLCLARGLGCLLCCLTLARTVSTIRAPGINFSKNHTYRSAVAKGQHFDPSVEAPIRQSIDSQRAARGLTKADDGADLSVAYQIAIAQEEKWQAYEIGLNDAHGSTHTTLQGDTGYRHVRHCGQAAGLRGPRQQDIGPQQQAKGEAK